MKKKWVLLVSLIGGIGIGLTLGVNLQSDQTIDSYDKCVAAGYPVQESNPARCAIPGGKSFAQEIETALEGTIVCLPHKNTDGPQTLECAAGLKTDDGSYYSLKSDGTDSSLAGSAGSNKRVRVTGVLKQEESDIYQSKGAMQIKRYDFL